MDAKDFVPILGLLLGGGGAGAVVAFRKLPAERDSIVVSAAEGVVMIQQKTLDSMVAQIKDIEERQKQERLRSEQERDRLEKALIEERERAEHALAECERREMSLRERVESLQGQVDNLQREVGDLRMRPPDSRTRSTDQGEE